MTPKEYLSQYSMIERRIQYLEQWEERWHRREMRITPPSMAHLPFGRLENLIRSVRRSRRSAEWRKKIIFEIDRAADLRREIAAAIAAVPDPVQREVLERKYIGMESVKQIGKAMGYSEDYINHLHGWDCRKS